MSISRCGGICGTEQRWSGHDDTADPDESNNDVDQTIGEERPICQRLDDDAALDSWCQRQQPDWCRSERVFRDHLKWIITMYLSPVVYYQLYTCSIHVLRSLFLPSCRRYLFEINFPFFLDRKLISYRHSSCCSCCTGELLFKSLRLSFQIGSGWNLAGRPFLPNFIPIFDLTSYFQDGGHSVISHRKVLSPSPDGQLEREDYS